MNTKKRFEVVYTDPKTPDVNFVVVILEKDELGAFHAIRKYGLRPTKIKEVTKWNSK